MAQFTRRAALGLIGAGGVLLAADTFGFSQVVGNRGVNVATGGRETSLIALVDADYNDIPHNDFETVAYLRNNLSNDVEVDYTMETSSGDTTISFDGEQDTFISGTGLLLSDQEPIGLQCDNNPDETDNRLVVTIEEARSSGITIQNADFELPFVCGGAVLDIRGIEGLSSQNPDHYYEAAVEIAETANERTEGFNVRLEITGDEVEGVYNHIVYPGDIKDDLITAEFGDIGELREDDYDYTVTADADNAIPDVVSGSFTVTEDDLPPNLTVRDAWRGDNNATVRFTVENEGDRPAIIEALSIERATGNHEVSHVQRDGNEFERTGDEGALNNRIDVGASRQSLDEYAIIDPQETVEFSLGRFRRQSGNTTNMNKGEADITLYLDSESDQQLFLRV